MSTKQHREQFNRDGAWLRRARKHYALLTRSWVDDEAEPRAFLARLYVVAERAQGHGLYSERTCVRQVMFGLLTKWRQSDQMSWWPWMHSDKRRASLVDWSIKTAWIRDDARKVSA